MGFISGKQGWLNKYWCKTPYYQNEGKNPHDHLIDTKKTFEKMQHTFMRKKKELKKQNRKECPQPDKGHL